jgi:hypothetical protein
MTPQKELKKGWVKKSQSKHMLEEMSYTKLLEEFRS